MSGDSASERWAYAALGLKTLPEGGLKNQTYHLYNDDDPEGCTRHCCRTMAEWERVWSREHFEFGSQRTFSWYACTLLLFAS